MAETQDALARLSSAPAHRLRIEWRRHFGTDPPERLSQDLLLRATAYKLQERAFGGLNQAARTVLRNLAGKITTEGVAGALRLAPTIKPGVRLVRDWRGQAHSVLVLEDGFDYRGERYGSLTEIACQITGARWSGPRFFGVTPVREKAGLKASRVIPHQDAEAGADGQV